MRRPSLRTSTRPTSSSTRRCLETEGWGRPRPSTISPTARSCATRKLRMSRRRGSATALKPSEVVAARDMGSLYSHIGICQALFLKGTEENTSKHVCAVPESGESKEVTVPIVLINDVDLPKGVASRFSACAQRKGVKGEREEDGRNFGNQHHGLKTKKAGGESGLHAILLSR